MVGRCAMVHWRFGIRMLPVAMPCKEARMESLDVLRKGARSRWVIRMAIALGLLIALPLAAGAAPYIDTFNSDPGLGVGATSFSTGTSATGMSYSISGGDFVWWSYGGDGNSGTIDIMSTLFDPATEKVTIQSRDGKAFVFTSVWVDIVGDGWSIKGYGPEPFTISAGTGSSGTESPTGGAKLVTKVEITSSDFDLDYLDTVTVELDVAGAAIYGNGNLIVNGDSSPSATDGTSLGTTPAGTPISQDFDLRNLGDATLTVDSTVTISGAGFSITQQPASPIAVGSESTLTVQFNPSTAGVVTGTVTIDNNSAADDYTFNVTAEGIGDFIPPQLTKFERLDPATSPTNADTLEFRATFNEDVQYVSIDDFVVSGTTATVVALATTSPDVYTLRVSGGDLAGYDGTVGIDLAGGQNIADLWDNALPSGEPPTDETYLLDNSAPTDPTPTSPSHTVSVWDNDNTIDIAVAGASDAGTGVDGFEIQWDQSATWTPTGTKEQEESWAGATFTATSNGDWYFHIATVDNVGNWTSTQHLGPFQIDTPPPSVPTGLDPASGSYTADTSPILSWGASTDTGGSGIRTTDAYRIVVTGPVNRDTYVSDTDYNPTLSEGTFIWKVYARDNAGNTSAYTADYTLTIDATRPDVTVNQSGGQADPTTASPVVFTAVFDEPINDATFTDADVTIGGTATTGAVTVTEIA
ncbi:MAG: choice-of-anchor D domain-containing protein, partial [Candidatus Atribacteria bacterium]